MKLNRLNHIAVATPSILPFKGRWPVQGVGGVSRFSEETPTVEASPYPMSPLRRVAPAASPRRGGFTRHTQNIIMTL
jgi:hypothetical protein